MTKSYPMGSGEVHALRWVDLSIDRGEYAAVTGPSGSGKSTLMNLIGCLDTPTTGVYELDGVPVQDLEDEELAAIRNRKIGFVFQTFNLLPRLDGVGNVELPLLYSGLDRQQRQLRARAVLEQVGLSPRAAHRPSELSGGERQRVAIARALVNGPDILLADEPTGNLDSATSGEIMELFDDLHSAGHTLVVVTHEAEIAARARRRIRLRDGRIESDSG